MVRRSVGEIVTAWCCSLFLSIGRVGICQIGYRQNSTSEHAQSAIICKGIDVSCEVYVCLYENDTNAFCSVSPESGVTANMPALGAGDSGFESRLSDREQKGGMLVEQRRVV